MVMTRENRLIFLYFALALLSSSCLSIKQPSAKIDFYTLEYEPMVFRDLQPLPFALRLERFTVASTYDTNRIVYRDSSFKRAAYVYHKWHDSPADLVTYFLGRDMKESGLFEAVLTYESSVPSSYTVEGNVNEFFEWDADEAWDAILSLSLALTAQNERGLSKRILFQKTYRARQPCKKRNPKALAEAMSRAMGGISGEIIRDVYRTLKEDKSGRKGAGPELEE